MKQTHQAETSEQNMPDIFDMFELSHFFQLPISFNDKKVRVKDNIMNDLELVKTQNTEVATTDASSTNPMCSYLFNTQQSNKVSCKVAEMMMSTYTTDVTFLKDTQTLLKEYAPLQTDDRLKYDDMLDVWSEMKSESNFKDKYFYVKWSMFESLNQSELFLQCMSLYNLASPVISLLIPILILIVPFFIIRLKGLPLSVSEYVTVLTALAQSHALGKLFTQFHEVPFSEKLYLLLSAFFYVFSIYQNVTVCANFHSNMITIHKHFDKIRAYLNMTLQKMDHYLVYSSRLPSPSHAAFHKELTNKRTQLHAVANQLSQFTAYSMPNVQKIQEIGGILMYFYQLHELTAHNEAIMYSLGFNGYLDCLHGLQQNIAEGKVHFAAFTKNAKKTLFRKAYYAPLKDGSPIKNTLALKKNIILTGPNASGKTTTLKTTLLNILFTQQLGCGFYESARVCPFAHVHCYLNIPDTSGRDSLFQAEARRCKEILDVVQSCEEETHFCAFDELYSGTNPEEAVTSATAFMRYLTKNEKVHCILTTHFTQVCKNLEKNSRIVNCHMITHKVDDNNNASLVYKYKLAEGISEMKGGFAVLTDMNYPKEIIEDALQNQ